MKRIKEEEEDGRGFVNRIKEEEDERGVVKRTGSKRKQR